MSREFTHLDESGKIKMVDISEKMLTERMAVASGTIVMRNETLVLISEKAIPKGDVFTVAKVAGILAAKRTAELIPLCHLLQLSSISVELEPDASLPGVRITAMVKTNGRTGVEMEALTSVSVAALTIYDMVKAVDKSMIIGEIMLLEKHGGKSGDFYRD